MCKEIFDYELLSSVLKTMIPKSEYIRITSQEYCEYESEFLGFIREYYALAQIIPKHYAVIDFGSYLAAQAYYFQNHKRYISVDVDTMDRFTPANAQHYVSSIQEFIHECLPTLDLDLETTFAICSYVPDWDAQALVRNTFPNCFVFYPAGNENETSLFSRRQLHE